MVAEAEPVLLAGGWTPASQWIDRDLNFMVALEPLARTVVSQARKRIIQISPRVLIL